MNDDTFERLLIDDALGALTPDQSELLAAYAAATGNDSQLRTWQRVASAARLALPPEPARSIPQFPRRALRVHQFWRAGKMGLAIAAILLLGIGLGANLIRQRPAANPGAPVALTPHPAPPVATAAGVADFWSSSRLIALALEQKPARNSSAQMPWSVSGSRIGAMP